MVSNGFFCSEFCRHIGKRLDEKVKVNLKIYAVTDWEANN